MVVIVRYEEMDLDAVETLGAAQDNEGDCSTAGWAAGEKPAWRVRQVISTRLPPSGR